ncbi:ATP-grasp domain-containing protein [Micromonospora sp. NPDC048170]|uniref:ATP-grasp domain-containing protein n=1 Tax=Micromonospora sp. NPDC048170 TaxID=3154819 RepID=UPI0033C3866F
MKLLAIETSQYLGYYLSRYAQVEDLGATLYVLNGEGEPDFWPAERYQVVGSRHIDEIIAAAKQWHQAENFDGVLTFSESSVITVAAVAEALGLPGIGVETAVNCRNKYLMRQAYQRVGASSPRFRLAGTLAEAQAAAEEFGYPVIVKPTHGAGSNFVFKVGSPTELAERYAQAQEGSRDMFWARSEPEGVDLGPSGLLVESFLDGSEHLMEVVVWDDEVYLGSVVDRITMEGETFDDDVHHAPTSLSPQDLAAVHEVVAAGMRAQGLRRSVGHAEVRFHEGSPHLLEIAARVGGGGLDMIARLTADHDPIAAAVDIARGVRPRVRHFQPTGTHTASMCLICAAGTVAGVRVPAEVSDSERTFDLKITARPGDVIKRPPHGNTILGFLGVTGTSEEDAVATMVRFADLVEVDFAD